MTFFPILPAVPKKTKTDVSISTSNSSPSINSHLSKMHLKEQEENSIQQATNASYETFQKESQAEQEKQHALGLTDTQFGFLTPVARATTPLVNNNDISSDAVDDHTGKVARLKNKTHVNARKITTNNRTTDAEYSPSDDRKMPALTES